MFFSTLKIAAVSEAITKVFLIVVFGAKLSTIEGDTTLEIMSVVTASRYPDEPRLR